MELSSCPPGRVREVTQRGAGTGFVPEPYDSFMHSHLCYYGYFRGEPCPWGLGPLCVSPELLGLQPCSLQGQKNPLFLGDPSEHHPTKVSSTGSAHASCLRQHRQELSSE